MILAEDVSGCSPDALRALATSVIGATADANSPRVRLAELGEANPPAEP